MTLRVACMTGLSVSETVALLGFSHKTGSRITQRGEERKKNIQCKETSCSSKRSGENLETHSVVYVVSKKLLKLNTLNLYCR